MTDDGKDQETDGPSGAARHRDLGNHDHSVPGDHGHAGERGAMVAQLGKDPECREALDRLYHYLDGELTEGRRLEIKEHLETCLPCLEAFDFEAELKLLIARRCRDELPAQLRIRVAVALSEASTSIAGSEVTVQDLFGNDGPGDGVPEGAGERTPGEQKVPPTD